MIWYRCKTYGSPIIERFEVVNETNSFVTYKKPYFNFDKSNSFIDSREAKFGSYHIWYKTFDEVKSRLIELVEQEIQAIVMDLADAESRLDKIKNLCE